MDIRNLDALCYETRIKMAKARQKRQQLLQSNPQNLLDLAANKQEIKGLGSLLCTFNQRRGQIRAEQRRATGGTSRLEAIAVACERILDGGLYRRVMEAAEHIESTDGKPQSKIHISSSDSVIAEWIEDQGHLLGSPEDIGDGIHFYYNIEMHVLPQLVADGLRELVPKFHADLVDALGRIFEWGGLPGGRQKYSAAVVFDVMEWYQKRFREPLPPLKHPFTDKS
jgi:hypothetical protein